MDRDLEARAIDVRDRQGEGFLEPESSALDGGEGDLVVQGGGGREEPSDLLNTEDGGETVCSLRANEREGVPVAREDVLREEADATGAADIEQVYIEEKRFILLCILRRLRVTQRRCKMDVVTVERLDH